MSKRKILIIILVVVLIFTCVFLFNLGRKVIVLSKYSDKYNENLNFTNFYKKMNVAEDVVTEIWRKGNLGLLKRTEKDDIKMIYFGQDFNWIIVDNKDGKTAVKMNKEGFGIENQTLETQTLYLNSFFDKVKLAFISNITTEKLNNIECYKVNVNKEWQVFINKSDFMIVRELNGSTDTGIIEYKINEVRDEDVLMPNLAGYTINDTTQQTN